MTAPTTFNLVAFAPVSGVLASVDAVSVDLLLVPIDLVVKHSEPVLGHVLG